MLDKKRKKKSFLLSKQVWQLVIRFIFFLMQKKTKKFTPKASWLIEKMATMITRRSQDVVKTEIPNCDTLNEAQDKCCCSLVALLFSALCRSESSAESPQSKAFTTLTGSGLTHLWSEPGLHIVLHSWHQVMARHTQCRYVFLTQALGFLTPS